MTPIFVADDIANLEGAACYNPDAEGHPGPDLWFATDLVDQQRGTTQAAIRVCGRCPVRMECLQIALKHDEKHGIFGGFDMGNPEQKRRAKNLAGRNAA